ncbi:MAG: hypothetical protein ACR2I5_09810 [Candidatus Limnocylindria bacterium]
MTNIVNREQQLRDRLEQIGYRLLRRHNDAGATVYHVNHAGNHNHAWDLATLDEAEEWLRTAEPASDECPLFDTDPRMEAPE